MAARLASIITTKKGMGKCVSKHFLCLIDRYRKVALGRKKAGQNCQISVGKILC